MSLTFKDNMTVISIEGYEGIIKDYPDTVKVQYIDVNQVEQSLVGNNIDKSQTMGRFLFDNGEFISAGFSNFSGR